MSRFLTMAIAALAATLTFAIPQEGRAASQPSCGLNNGKAASGDPIVLGANRQPHGP